MPDQHDRWTRVPEALRALPRWVCWKHEHRGGRPTKVPYCARAGGHASVTDPNTWCTFGEACGACATGEYDGIGFVFTEPDSFCGIDLDDCIDQDDKIKPGAREILESLDSYSEVSPSGRGVKVFLIGRKPDGVGCRSQATESGGRIEIYDRNRFFTVTGDRIEAFSPGIELRQAELEVLCHRLWPHSSEPRCSHSGVPVGFDGDDERLLECARAARNGDRFARLWEGDTSMHGGDDSGADLALCNFLAFWTGRDAERIDRLFRRSGLYRAKWDEQRGERTYGQMTIEEAIAGCHGAYASSSPKAASGAIPVDGAHAGPAVGCEPLGYLGHPDPVSGRLILSPKQTLPTAQAYLREFHRHADGHTLIAYGGLLMEWIENRYREVEDESVMQRLQPWLHGALRYEYSKQSRKVVLVNFESNPATVKDARDTIRTRVRVPSATVSPSWLDGGKGRPPASELLPCRSMNLHIPTGDVLPASPALFTTSALDFDYDPGAKPPSRWMQFLEQLFGEDWESVELLQEWMGYCLTADTKRQKMLLLVGPTRSGKGTIGRILTRLVGVNNVVGPTTSGLAGTFGLQPLIGKSVAIVSDARFSGGHVGTVVERLLCVSGEDTLTIDRKYLASVSMKLPTRFIFLTNEIPVFSDASTALARRFLVLRLTRTFHGTEDLGLTDCLIAELPGILLWAIEGWKRLRQRGRFVQPRSGHEAVLHMERVSSPVSGFLRDRCTLGVDQRVGVSKLFQAFQEWCAHEEVRFPGERQAFGRALAAAAPAVERRRGTGGVAFYEGIALRDLQSDA